LLPLLGLHETIFPTTLPVPSALTTSVYEFPVVLSVAVHVPTMSPAVPLKRVQVIPSFSHVMVVAVIVTPVCVLVPNLGPSHAKSEFVQFPVNTPVVGFHVYVPLAVAVTPCAWADRRTEIARAIWIRVCATRHNNDLNMPTASSWILPANQHADASKLQLMLVSNWKSPRLVLQRPVSSLVEIELHLSPGTVI
jgi:hypothetical protein